MHVKKNICESLIDTLLQIKGKGKDHENTRAGLEEMGLRPELHVNDTDQGKFLAPSCITLSKKEKKEFCEFLHGVKVPSGYSSNIRRLVSMKELKMVGGMKTHDCHVMLMQMIAVGIRNMLPIGVREAIMSLCFFFNAIGQKVLDMKC